METLTLAEVVEIIVDMEARFRDNPGAVSHERLEVMQALLATLKEFAAKRRAEGQQEQQRKQVMEEPTIRDRLRGFLDRKLHLTDSFRRSGNKTPGIGDWEKAWSKGVSGETVLTKAADLVALSLEKGAKPLL